MRLRALQISFLWAWRVSSWAHISERASFCSADCCLVEMLLVLSLSSVCLSPQARVTDLKSCVIILRIFRDMCSRLAGWQPLKGWVGDGRWIRIKISHSVEDKQTVKNTNTSLSVLRQNGKLVSQDYNHDWNWCSRRRVECPLSVCPRQPLELICEKAIATCNRPLGPGEALRRVMECIASGILLPGQWSQQLPRSVCCLHLHSLSRRNSRLL